MLKNFTFCKAENRKKCCCFFFVGYLNNGSCTYLSQAEGNNKNNCTEKADGFNKYFYSLLGKYQTHIVVLPKGEIVFSKSLIT